MSSHEAPGVYVEETGFSPPPIADAATSVTGFIGSAARGPAGRARRVRSWHDYERIFGGADGGELAFAVRAFFDNGGSDARVVRVGRRAPSGRWLAALEATAGCNLLVLPGLRALSEAAQMEIATAAAQHCLDNRAFLILDPPRDASGLEAAAQWATDFALAIGGAARNVAAYWPDVLIEAENGQGRTSPVGAIAGVYARTDSERGVWKAPAGVDARMIGVSGLAARLTDGEIQRLVAASLNPLRHVGNSTVPWGARTLAGPGSEWKYVPVRRLALFIENSLYEGLEWAVFEPNDVPLWARVRLSAANFLDGLWRKQALQGGRPNEAWYVRCDRTTMTQHDIDSGRLVVEIGIAPLRPAEFVVVRIGLWTADADPDDD